MALLQSIGSDLFSGIESEISSTVNRAVSAATGGVLASGAGSGSAGDAAAQLAAWKTGTAGHPSAQEFIQTAALAGRVDILNAIASNQNAPDSVSSGTHTYNSSERQLAASLAAQISGGRPETIIGPNTSSPDLGQTLLNIGRTTVNTAIAEGATALSGAAAQQAAAAQQRASSTSLVSGLGRTVLLVAVVIVILILVLRR